MTTTRHKTVLEIDAGPATRQVQGLGQSMERAFDPAIIEGFERSMERLSRTLERLETHLGRLGDTTGGGGRRGGGGGGGRDGPRDAQGRFVGGDGSAGKGGPSWFKMATASAAGNMAANVAMGMYGRGQAAISTAMQGQGFVGSMLSGIPIFGPALGGAVSGIQGFYGQYAQNQQSVLGGFGRSGLGNRGLRGLYGAGADLGLGPNAIASMLPGYAQQTGLKGRALAGVAPQLMEAQQTLGFGNLGAVLGGAGAAGGRTQNPGKILEDAIASGFQAGIRESRMDQFLAQMGGWLESIRNQGINLSAESAAALVGVMGNLGLRGGSAMRVAQNAAQAMGNLGKGGGFGQIAALRAAGLGEGRSFMQARLFAQEKPQVVMQRLAQQAAAGGQDTESTALYIETLMRSLGIEVSAKEAMDIAANAGQAGAGLGKGAEAAKAAKARGEKGLKGAGLGVAKTQAGLEAQGIGVGAGVADEAIRIKQLEMKLARTTLPLFTNAIGGAVDALTHLVSQFDPKKSVNMNVGTAVIEAGEMVFKGIFGDETGEAPGKDSPRKGTDWETTNENQSPLARTVRAIQRGDWEAVWSGETTSGGSAKEKEAYHLRKAAEAAEQSANESKPSDNQLRNSAN